MKKNSIVMKKINIIHIIIGIGIFVALLAIGFFIFQVPDFYPQVLAIIASAFLGAGVTAWITKTLLDDKQESEEKKEKRIKTYEEKLRIYQDFLKGLYEVINNDKITKEAAIQLQFQTSYITMHTQSKHIKTIALEVKSIVNNLEDDNNARLMEQLFNIVKEFREELYGEEYIDDNPEDIKKAVEAFCSIMDAVQVKQTERINSASNDTQQANIVQNLNDFSEALRKRIERHLANWFFESDCSDNGVTINIGLNGYENDIRVILSHEDSGEHYFQVHLEHENFHELYKEMKQDIGGRQNKWCWWKYLDANWRLLACSQEIKTRNWDKLLDYLDEWIVYLLHYVEKLNIKPN